MFRYVQELLNTALDYYLQLKSLRQMHKAILVELDYRDLFLEKALHMKTQLENIEENKVLYETWEK